MKHWIILIFMLMLPLALDSRAQSRPEPTKVAFHNALSARERHFILTTPHFQEQRHAWIEAIRRNEVHWGEADLNDDGAPERLLILASSTWCGSDGCLMRILTLRNGEWRFFADASGEPDYVRVQPTSDHGWHRIGYGQRGDFRWNGCEYLLPEEDRADRRDGLPPCRP